MPRPSLGEIKLMAASAAFARRVKLLDDHASEAASLTNAGWPRLAGPFRLRYRAREIFLKPPQVDRRRRAQSGNVPSHEARHPSELPHHQGGDDRRHR